MRKLKDKMYIGARKMERLETRLKIAKRQISYFRDKNEKLVSKSKHYEEMQELLNKEQLRSNEKSKHINNMIIEHNEQQQVYDKLKATSEMYFKWFRIEEERRIALEHQLEIAKGNIKVITIGIYLLGMLIIITNLKK